MNRLQDKYLTSWQFINQKEHYDQRIQWHCWFQRLEHLAMVKENFNVQQPSYGMHSQLTFVNPKHWTILICCRKIVFVLEPFWCLISSFFLNQFHISQFSFIHILLWNNRIIFVISYIYVFHKFMYSTFEQVLSMKRVLYKFCIIIIVIVFFNQNKIHCHLCLQMNSKLNWLQWCHT